MSGGPEVRQQLADELRPVLYAHLAGRGVTLADGTKGLLSYESWTAIADGLLADGQLSHEVERIAADRAAEALREAAEQADTWSRLEPPGDRSDVYAHCAARLRARAEAMVTGRQEGP